MHSPLEVTDSQSNRPEHIASAVTAIGKSAQKRLLFEAIYTHKKRVRLVAELAKMTGLTEVRVLQLGGELRGDHIVDQHKVDGRVAYGQRPFFQRNKKKILALLDRPAGLKKLATKRTPSVSVRVTVPRTKGEAQPKYLTVDEIDSFSKVRGVRSSAKTLPSSMSEQTFKEGIQAIIGESGTFKDWGGEASDLYSSRLLLNGRRFRVAFGFKGPGLKGPLVPARLGKNGDQMKRLFSEPADVYIVQHWREIQPSVIDLMEMYAERKAREKRKVIYYSTIDGQDSNRLRLAYPTKFRKSGKRSSRR
jgi:hypothetical protein